MLEAAQLGELMVEWRDAPAGAKLARADRPLGAIITCVRPPLTPPTTRQPMQSAWVRYGR